MLTPAWYRRDAHLAAINFRKALVDIDRSFAWTPCPVYDIVRYRGFTVEDTHLILRTAGMTCDTTIFVDHDAGPIRTRFTVAHELGHIVMHKSEPPKDAARLLRGEYEANAFASATLMPPEDVEQMLSREQTSQPVEYWAHEEHSHHLITRLRRRFQTSTDTTLQVLVDMGLVEGYTPWESFFEAHRPYKDALSRLSDPLAF